MEKGVVQVMSRRGYGESEHCTEASGWGWSKETVPKESVPVDGTKFMVHKVDALLPLLRDVPHFPDAMV